MRRKLIDLYRSDGATIINGWVRIDGNLNKKIVTDMFGKNESIVVDYAIAQI